jgi:NAD(P)-dependent dehydrogenase (short-subunit alcohol dehydrogenase family)
MTGGAGKRGDGPGSAGAGGAGSGYGGPGSAGLFDLSGRVAVVTGSTRGIGRSLAQGLACQGADLVVTSRNQQDCDVAAGEIRALGRAVLAKSCDVTDLRSVRGLAEAVLAEFGKVDILVNNAGTALTKPAEDLDEEDWDRVMDVDLKGVFLCSTVFGRHMIARRAGKIVNIASMLGLVGDKQILPYCAAKGGVVQMTRALALEWARYNIQVNALCPGYVKTAMNEADITGNEKIYSHIIGKTPMRRLGEVDELIGPLVFLASDASSFMTGQMLVVDGGWTAE